MPLNPKQFPTDKLWGIVRDGRREAVHNRVDEWGSDDPKIGGGQCARVSEALNAKHGIDMDVGCYHGEQGKHIAHVWNKLPDGRILDATADQFGEPNGWRVTSGNDRRYCTNCGVEGRDG